MEVDTTQFNDIYKEMAELLGDAAALKMWNRYAGVSVSFPKQLYSREFIHDNSDVMKPSDIARTIGLTERRVRQIIKEEREKE